MWRPCLLAAALLAAPQPQELLTLEVRVFDKAKEVTEQTRVTVHRAGDRGTPAGQREGAGMPPIMKVPPGIYDAQAVQERDGRVLNIRWAERLVVMPYPDEAGHHLQVINFATGYGALQVRPASPIAAGDAIVLVGPGEEQHLAAATSGRAYILFVVPAGQYTLQVRRGSRNPWQHGIDVPLDRTRFIVVP